MKKTLIVPAGIGDFSWIWSKVVSVRNEIEKINVVDGWPHRTVPYIQLCGMESDYCPMSYAQIQMNMRIHGADFWDDYRKAEVAGMGISANAHLEAGKPLKNWLPDLPVDYHYRIHVSDEAKRKATSLLKDFTLPLVGISCASYRGSEAWKTWGRMEWVDCLNRIKAEGWTPLLLGGFWDDLTHGVACTLGLPDLVGKTSVEEGVAVLALLDAYVGFSSGLGVIRTVQNHSAFMLWPDFQVELSTAWADPEQLETRQYVAHLWRPVDDVWPVMREYLKCARS